MALSRLLQPNPTLRVCRLGFSAARARFCSSGCSDGDGSSASQLKEKAAAEGAKIMLPKHIVSEAVLKEPGLPEATSLGNKMAEYGGPFKPKTLSGLFAVHKDDSTGTVAENEEREEQEATSLGNIMAEYGGPRKPETPSGRFVVHKDDPTETVAENEKIEKQEETLVDYPMMSEKDERPSQSNGCQKGLDLKHSAMQSANDRATLKTDRPKNLASLFQSPEHLNEPHKKEAEKDLFNGLIDSISIRLKNLPSNPTKLCSSTALTKDNSSNANVQRSGQHDRLNLLTFPAGTSTIEDRETSKSGFDSVELKEQKQHLKVCLPTSNNVQRQKQIKNSSRTESEGNKALVRFLQTSVTTSQIFEFFRNCGEILKIECPAAQTPLLKTACINFKTRNGLENAIRRSGMHLGGAIIVESATSENSTTTIPVPHLLGDPDIPAALVKNPTRTIRIEELTQEISSRHIIEALAFCKSKVSGYFIGSSHSVVYVELETEIGKERALAKQSIIVLGRHLVMLRIDCPRTTVVRITSKDSLDCNKVVPICKSLGDICTALQRYPNMIDVHFKVVEWPNMLKILNRLNGCMVEGRRLQAEPAPVFPPEVLLALWRHPGERKHLKATVQALLLKLDSKLDTSDLAFLENDIFST